MICVLTGPVHSGKTTLLKKVVSKLKEDGVGVDGFLSEAVVENGISTGYDLCDLKAGRSTPFIRKKGEKEWQRAGPFYFLPEGLAEAERIIRSHQDTDLLVVDEVGPLEMRGEGLWPALSRVLGRSSSRILLIAREGILEEFSNLMDKSDIRIFRVSEENTYSKIIAKIKKKTG